MPSYRIDPFALLEMTFKAIMFNIDGVYVYVCLAVCSYKMEIWDVFRKIFTT